MATSQPELVAKTNSNFYPVILAGGRGTRFWPLSRRRRSKQLLALDGKRTMIQQTVARLLPLAPPSHCWIITNEDLRREIIRQFPRLPHSRSSPNLSAEHRAGHWPGGLHSVRTTRRR